ncbi:MAG: hypothetical protein L2C94_002175 [Aigarchaeota archaeon]|nr:hypothetical protein [Candidatus Wolframiiraptor gerlachensis]
MAVDSAIVNNPKMLIETLFIGGFILEFRSLNNSPNAYVSQSWKDLGYP